MADLDVLLAARGFSKREVAATAPPTATDDSSKGYSIGSTYFMPGTAELWMARDVTINAAKWVKLDLADFDRYFVGRHYLPADINSPNAASPSNPNTIRLFLGMIKHRITIDQLSCRFTAAGTNAQIAIYASKDTRPTGLPLAKTAIFAAVASTNGISAAIDPATLTLEPGPYWFASNLDAQATAIILSAGGVPGQIIGGASAGDVLTAQVMQAFSVSQAFGAWPDLTGATLTQVTGNAVTPCIAFRVASVP